MMVELQGVQQLTLTEIKAPEHLADQHRTPCCGPGHIDVFASNAKIHFSLLLWGARSEFSHGSSTLFTVQGSPRELLL
jgi:hypothetical protein